VMDDAGHATAIHEAGHAVVLWKLKVHVCSVSIIPDDDGRRIGGVNIVPGSEEHLPTVDRIAIVVAGRQAAHAFGTRDHPSMYHEDTAMLLRLLDPIPEEQRSALINAGADRAFKIVDECRSKVVRVAARVLKTRHIEAAEFAALMSDP